MRSATSEDQGERLWAPLADSVTAEISVKLALSVAERLREPAQVEEAVIQARMQSDNPTLPQWISYGFAQGYAGLALLWGQLDRCFPDEGWDGGA